MDARPSIGQYESCLRKVYEGKGIVSKCKKKGKRLFEYSHIMRELRSELQVMNRYLGKCQTRKKVMA